MTWRMILFSGAILFLAALPATVKAGDTNFSVSLKGNFTTGSQLFPNPNSPDEIKRAQFFPIEDFFGYGVEVQYKIPETNLAVGLSADYIRATTTRSTGLLAVPVKDGYRVIPIELTGYFNIPVSGPTFGVYMGGGAGAYFGRRIYEIADVQAQTTDVGHGFGIHVLGGVKYRFTDWFGLNVEMKFRDLQFKTTNQFSTSSVMYNGNTVLLPQGPLASRVHTDGVIFQLGTTFSF